MFILYLEVINKVFDESVLLGNPRKLNSDCNISTIRTICSKIKVREV